MEIPSTPEHDVQSYPPGSSFDRSPPMKEFPSDSDEPLLPDDRLSSSSTVYRKDTTQLEGNRPLKLFIYTVIPISLGFGLLNIGFMFGVNFRNHNRITSPTHVAGSGLIWTMNIEEIGWGQRRFDGSLYSTNKYRGSPSKAIDDEWDRFTTSPWMSETAVVMNVSAQEIKKSGNDRFLDTVVELDPENGGGYMGTLEVFHQLHCLNVLRKWTYLDHYKDIDPFWAHKNSHTREHTDHCIDMIRQSLMCNSDMGLIMFHWVKGMPLPSPDFHTMHQCRDPEAVLEWAKLRAAPISHPIVKKGGEVELSGFL